MKTDPTDIAFISETQKITYPEYYQQALSFANQLKKQNIKAGEKLAIYQQNSLDYPSLLLALFHLKIVAVPLNFRFPPQEIHNLLKKISCPYLVQEQANKTIEGIKNIPFETLKAKEFLVQEKNFVPELFPFGAKITPEKATQEATIVFTSGSSKRPKGALHTLGNHYYNALGSNQNLPFQPGDRWLLSLPLFHVGGLAILMRALLGNGTVVFPTKALSLFENIQKFKITHLSLVSTQLYQLLEESTPSTITTLRSLKGILLGGSAFAPNLIQQAIDQKLAIYPTYGSTEATSQITTMPSKRTTKQLWTAGKALPYREVKLDSQGQILIRGPVLFKGYVEKEKLSPERDAKGWFHTGDLGELDLDGYLKIKGRQDKMFISGGENIQPEEIEHCLGEIKGIAEVFVVPIENQKYGKRPVAFIKLKSGFDWSPEHYRQIIKQKLPSFKIPEIFFPFPAEVAQQGIKFSRHYFQQLAMQQERLKEMPRNLKD